MTSDTERRAAFEALTAEFSDVVDAEGKLRDDGVLPDADRRGMAIVVAQSHRRGDINARVRALLTEKALLNRRLDHLSRTQDRLQEYRDRLTALVEPGEDRNGGQEGGFDGEGQPPPDR